MATLAARQRLLVLYGSQTGCAKETAEAFHRMGLRRCFDCQVYALDAYDWRRLPNERLVLFVVSTTGDGDPPDNMVAFWKFLRNRHLPTTALSSVLFSVFGMGDSSYALYNAIARKLHVRMRQLGAKEFHPLGLGDDQSPKGVEADADTWGADMWASLLRRFPAPPGFVIDDTPAWCPAQDIKYDVRVVPAATETAGETPVGSASDICQFYAPPADAYNANGSVPLKASVAANERLTSTEWTQNVRHLELQLDATNPCIQYVAGDVAVVYPENMFDVDAFLKEFIGGDSCGEDAVQVVAKKAGDLPPFPSPCSLRDLFVKYVGVLGMPKRYALEQLSHFAQDEEQQEKLLELSSSAGADLYHTYIRREKRNFIEVLRDFPSCRPPLDVLLSVIPFIRPREFSIASSGIACGGKELHLCVAVVEYLTFYRNPRRGLCSSWLSTAQRGKEIRLWIKRGVLRPPTNSSAPMIMVGPGTGVAPMRAHIQAREYARTKGPVGETILFFGNRHASLDFLYKDELESYASTGLLKLHTAFSRDLDKKVYVQHRLREVKESVWHCLSSSPETVLLVSGSSKGMPNDVYKVLLLIAQECGGLSEADAVQFFNLMKQQRRYVVECWS